MAETEDGQEKTEQATPKRLEEARKKGQVPRSREMTSMAMLLAAALALTMMGENMVSDLGDILHLGLSVERSKLFDHFAVIEIFGTALYQAMLAILPFLLIVALTALEILVAFLQAYVFAMLTCMYLNDAIHPSH